MATLVFEVKYGGLGDHLFFSHIPRIAKQSGLYDQVFLSSKSPLRHPDYKRLIWDMNPFLDGFVDEPGKYPPNLNINHAKENLLDILMLGLGLDDGKRFHEPELYFEPVVDEKYKGLTIYDPNYISGTGSITNTKGIEKWLRSNNLNLDYQMKLRERNLPFPTDKFLETATIEQFCSLIVSCENLLCLTTGTATLSAALKKPTTVFFGEGHKKIFRHSKMHEYVKIYDDYSPLAPGKRLVNKGLELVQKATRRLTR